MADENGENVELEHPDPLGELIANKVRLMDAENVERERGPQRGGAGRGKGKPEDVVYTPEWCARDMVEHFQPTGVVLDPCRGKGAFHDLLPEGSPWCEITEGSDFFDWSTPVDWVIGNPPYSLTRPWFRHSYDIADQFVYLVPCRNVWSGYGFLREIHEWGGLREIRTYGTGGRLGFPMGNAVAAFHGQRGYDGDTRLSFYDAISRGLLSASGRGACGEDGCVEQRPHQHSLDEPHNIVSWIEGERKGWFQCSCGEQFVTEGFDSEDKSMGALIVQHQAAFGRRPGDE